MLRAENIPGLTADGTLRGPRAGASRNSLEKGTLAGGAGRLLLGDGGTWPMPCSEKEPLWVLSLTFTFNWGNDGAKLQENQRDASWRLGQGTLC